MQSVCGQYEVSVKEMNYKFSFAALKCGPGRRTEAGSFATGNGIGGNMLCGTACSHKHSSTCDMGRDGVQRQTNQHTPTSET